MIKQKLSGPDRDLPRRSQMCLNLQPARIIKMRMLHAKLLRPLIHLLDKCRLRACQMLCHRHCGIITRSNFDAFDHILHRLFLTCLEETLRATHRRRMLSHDNRIVQRDIPAF